MTIRPATEHDLAGMAAIYDEQVRTGISTFDLEPPPASYWAHRVASDEPGDHVLVDEEGGEVVGFAYASSYRPRPGYRLTRETSVYLAEQARGRGRGRRLYDALLAPAHGRRDARGAGPDRAAQPGERRAARGLRVRASRDDARGGPEVRPVARHGVVPTDALSRTPATSGGGGGRRPPPPIHPRWVRAHGPVMTFPPAVVGWKWWCW